MHLVKLLSGGIAAVLWIHRGKVSNGDWGTKNALQRGRKKPNFEGYELI